MQIFLFSRPLRNIQPAINDCTSFLEARYSRPRSSGMPELYNLHNHTSLCLQNLYMPCKLYNFSLSDDYDYAENDLVFDEARRESGGGEETSYNDTIMSNVSSGRKFDLPGDESVMVEDTDIDDVDIDGEVELEKDIDSGTLEMSVAVPSHVA